MDIVASSLRSQRSYKELKEVFNEWEEKNKGFLFLDLAILHKNFEGVRLIGDLLGPNFFLSTYDNFEKVTPVYIAQILSRIHSDYALMSEFMLKSIEDSKPWNRRKHILWVFKHKKIPMSKALFKEIVLEYL